MTYFYCGNEYSVDMEKIFIEQLRKRDHEGLKQTLEKLIKFVCNAYEVNDRHYVNQMLLECIIVLSRAVIDCGVAYDEVSKVNQYFTKELFDRKDDYLTKAEILEAFNTYFEMVLDNEPASNIKVVTRTIDYINEHFDENITLETVADQVYLSPSYFSRVFKKEIGKNFSEYLTEVRINESKKLLIDLSFSLSEISDAVGFSNQSYFTKVFKKFCGISPYQFRKQNL